MIFLKIEELDRNDKPKTKVQVRIILPDAKTYHAHASEFKKLAEQTKGSMAVKMVCD